MKKSKIKYNDKPMTDEEIKELVKQVKKERRKNPDFKPEIGEFKIDIKY